MIGTVYILRCADGSYYTGVTKRDVMQCLWEHQTLPDDNYCASRRPVELVFTEQYALLIDAIEREKQIKRWSRLKKEALIANAYERLPSLSERGFKPEPGSASG